MPVRTNKLSHTVLVLVAAGVTSWACGLVMFLVVVALARCAALS